MVAVWLQQTVSDVIWRVMLFRLSIAAAPSLSLSVELHISIFLDLSPSLSWSFSRSPLSHHVVLAASHVAASTVIVTTCTCRWCLQPCEQHPSRGLPQPLHSLLSLTPCRARLQSPCAPSPRTLTQARHCRRGRRRRPPSPWRSCSRRCERWVSPSHSRRTTTRVFSRQWRHRHRTCGPWPSTRSSSTSPTPSSRSCPRGAVSSRRRRHRAVTVLWASCLFRYDVSCSACCCVMCVLCAYVHWC